MAVSFLEAFAVEVAFSNAVLAFCFAAALFATSPAQGPVLIADLENIISNIESSHSKLGSY